MNKYFGQRYSSFYKTLLHLNVAHRYVVTIFILMVFITGWYWGVYLTLEQRLKNQQKRILVYQRDLQNQRACNRNDSINNALEVIDSSLHEFLDNKSKDDSPLVDIVSLVQKIGLQLQGCSVAKEQKHDWYYQEEIHIDVSGTLAMVSTLFNLFQKSSHFLVACDQVKIVQKKNEFFDIRLKLKIISLA